MKDIRDFYLTAKSSGKPSDISAYSEAVNGLLANNPKDYVLNLEYIISSDIGLQTFDQFIEKYGLSIAVYDDVMACFEKCIGKCERNGKDASKYHDGKKKLEEFKEQHMMCFNMFESFMSDYVPEVIEEKEKDKKKYPDLYKEYVNVYYSFNENGKQNSRLLVGMIDTFGECAIPDALITASKFGDSALSTSLKYLESVEDFQTAEHFQWISECVREVAPEGYANDILTEMESLSLQGIVDKMRSRNSSVFREATLSGNDNAVFEYSEEELTALEQLISFREYQLTCTENTNDAIGLQNEIYSLYEEYDGMEVDSGDFEHLLNESVADMLPMDESPWMVNTRNKKTGDTPGYLANNHDLDYDADRASKRSSDGESSIEDFRRPSAGGSSDISSDDSDYGTSGTGSDTSSKSDPNAVNNYYYYTYNNSLNKNSNSFNKDSSSHDNHSRHDHSVTNDSSVHNSTRKVTDDHSTNKRVHSHNYDTPAPEDDGDDIQEESVYTDQLVEGFEYEFIESSNYYMDDVYDKHITGKWFIKSDNGADNCCVSVRGYSKPMRGRSAIIVLKKENDKWHALIKRKPNGEWEFPGGGWDKGETPKNAAVRELHEEAQTNAKDVKRIGTQIEFSPKKGNIPIWVKMHVKNSDDWWYGYYTAVFIGKEDGKYTGHINEEDYEDTFRWKPLTFIAKKFPHKLLDAIESYIQEVFHESVDNKYFPEAVDVKGKKFDKAYKAAFNYENGHMIKITYSLQGCEVTNIGLSKTMRDHVASVAEETNKENHRGHKATKNIRAAMVMLKGIIGGCKFIKNRKAMVTSFLNDHIGEIGYLDFQAKNCKIIDIYDLYEQKRVDGEIPIVGVYAARHMDSGKSYILSEKDLQKVHKIAESKRTKFHVSKFKIGDTEKWPTFMSTYWDKNSDRVIFNLNNEEIDSDERDRSSMELNNIPDIIGDLEMKGFHVSDEEVKMFLSKYRDTEKWIPDVIDIDVKEESEKKDVKTESARPWEVGTFLHNTVYTEDVGDSDDLRPESDHPIKDTLMDVDRKLVRGGQKIKKGFQNVQNAGKAAMKPVNRATGWVGKVISDWKDADETKIKEKMADPHARNNLFSAIGTCIKTGSLMKAGLLLNPVFLGLSIMKRAGKNKNEFRLRNEMIGELKAEIEIIDRKIDDARANGDKNASYKLMRLKNEINKKLARVGGGKGAVKSL